MTAPDERLDALESAWRSVNAAILTVDAAALDRRQMPDLERAELREAFNQLTAGRYALRRAINARLYYSRAGSLHERSEEK